MARALVSGLLDTNLIVRYLRGDQPDLAERAARIIEREADLHITDVVIVEVAHVLRSVYGVPREAIVDSLLALLRRPNLVTFGLGKDFVLRALSFCRASGRVSIPDAMIWAAARSSRIGAVYTFDERFPSDGVTLLRDLEAPPAS